MRPQPSPGLPPCGKSVAPGLDLESILSRENGNRAFAKVRANHGCPGIDSVPVEEVAEIFPAQWDVVRAAILAGTYRPRPLRRVEIPKPTGGVRKLGIPSVIDRVVQQSIAQALGPWFDRRFSRFSFAYRPGRSPRDAIAALQHLLARNDFGCVLHLDIRDFFDSVSHSVVRVLLEREPLDPRLVDLVEKGLKSGVVECGVVRDTAKGVPQGSPLSPLLANLVLHELDLWLTGQGFPFVRYADDIVIPLPVRGRAPALLDAIECQLASAGLELNREKTALTPWMEAEFLGFAFRPDPRGLPSRRASPNALRECFSEIDRLVASGSHPHPAEAQRSVAAVTTFVRGWSAYYGFTEEPAQIEFVFTHACGRLRQAFPNADLSPLGSDQPSAARSARAAGAAHVDYGGHVRPCPPGLRLRPDSPRGINLPATLRCWLTRLLRGRLFRVGLDFGRPGRGRILPRPTGIRVLIAGHQFRFRL